MVRELALNNDAVTLSSLPLRMLVSYHMVAFIHGPEISAYGEVHCVAEFTAFTFMYKYSWVLRLRQREPWTD